MENMTTKVYLARADLRGAIYRGHPGAFREGEVMQQFLDFREKFWSKFWISLYILYIFTSPSAQDREKSASLGRLFLPNHTLG